MRNRSILFVALALFLCLFMQNAPRAFAQDSDTKSGASSEAKPKGGIRKKYIAIGAGIILLIGGAAYMATKKKPAQNA